MSVDDFIDRQERWPQELRKLRSILTRLPVDESLKWGGPCYSYKGKNVVGIGAFKSYFGLWFFQGAMLDDCDAVLQNAQRGKTKAMRQWRMFAMNDIQTNRIKRCVRNAIANVDAGREIRPCR